MYNTFVWQLADLRLKLYQAGMPWPRRDCDGKPPMGQGAIGHLPSFMKWN